MNQSFGQKKRNFVYPKTELALGLQNLGWTGKYFPNIEEWEAYSSCVLSCCFNYFEGDKKEVENMMHNLCFAFMLEKSS